MKDKPAIASVQFNVEIPFDLVKQIKTDAIDKNVALAAYASVAFAHFLSLKTEHREAALQNPINGKRLGRKISVQAAFTLTGALVVTAALTMVVAGGLAV